MPIFLAMLRLRNRVEEEDREAGNIAGEKKHRVERNVEKADSGLKQSFLLTRSFRRYLYLLHNSFSLL